MTERPAVLGLDMIVGLPDTAVPGGRACDRQARQLLGRARGASVFSPPAYTALSADTYEAAQRRNRATAPDAPGLSKQTYHLFPRLRAVADAVTPARQHRIREVHPELAFYAMNGDAPLADSKRTDAGRAARRTLLARHGVPDMDDTLSSLATGAVGTDDVLDAHAACWTARRIYTGTAERCPPVSEAAPHNARGLRMEIWR
jgi:predicted RNase H-like nuclease